MKAKNIILAAMLVFFISPALASANYYIVMRSGSRMLVDQYWEQDGKISFYFKGDLVEMPSAVVKEILETKDVLPTAPIAALPPPPPADPASSKKVLGPGETGAKGVPGAGTKGAAPAAGDAAAAVAGGKEGEEPCVPGSRDLSIDEEFKVLNTRYNGRMGMERDDLINLSHELFVWRDAVLKRKLGAIYRDEVEKVYLMCDELEAIIRMR